MKTILLIGGGGHCKSVIDVIEQENKYRIVSVVDSSKLLNGKILGYPIIREDSNLGGLKKNHHYACITVGQIDSPALRIKLFEIATENGFIFPNIISPTAYVSKHAFLGSGNVIMHGAIVNASAVIGNNCIINSKALIEHDSVIKDFCHISTNAAVNGAVVVGYGSFVGSGAIIKNNTQIEEYSFIKAGSIVK